MKNNTATKLALIAKRSKHNPREKFNCLAHLMNEEYLLECFNKLKKGKAAGTDKRIKEDYTEAEIKQIIVELVDKLKTKKYKPKPVKRVFIKKANNKLRPLGIPTVIDKIVQAGITKILNAIYEPHFLGNSYGFRAGRNCHQALKAVYGMIMTRKVNWIIDADIKGFFDNVDHKWMIECLNQRINDKNFRSIIIKFLKAGIIQEGKYHKENKGTPQGGILSPVLANIYLHYVLDLWFAVEEKKTIAGYTELIRYADDFVIGAQNKHEAERILKDLKTRLRKFSLELSAEKTRIIEFGRFAEENNKRKGKGKPDTFDFLGMTHYCTKSKTGKFVMKVKTSRKKMNIKLKELNEWLKAIRNLVKAEEIWKLLRLKLIGHYNYYGISGNYKGIETYYYHTIRLTFKWLNRRSQKQSFNWQQFSEYLDRYPLPKPKLSFNMYDIW